MFVCPQDFIVNTGGSFRGHGAVGEALVGIHYDPGLARPYFDDKGRNCVLVNTGRRELKKKPDGSLILNKEGSPVMAPVYEKRLVADLALNYGMTKLIHNATVLAKEQWVTLSSIVRTAFRARLRAWNDLVAVSSYGGFDGMSTMMLEYQTMSDPGEAVVDFDGMSEGRADNPLYGLEGLPLPIIHSGFWYPERLLAISRKNGTPLNVRSAEAAGRRCAEMVEKILIGVVTGPTLGSQTAGAAGIAYGRTPSVYGYKNHPARITKTDVTAPTAGGWSPDVAVDDMLAVLDSLRAANFYGPFMVYHSTDWDRYMDGDYYALATSGMVAPNKTLRSRLKEITEIQDVRRLDFLPSSTDPFTWLVVSMQPELIQAVNGMDITLIQWPSSGGQRTNFKSMCIQAPLITPDYNGNCGIAHCTTS